MVVNAPRDRESGAFTRLDSAAAAVGDALCTVDKQEQQRSMSAHTIFGLIENNRLWPIKHGIRHFRITVCRKTVHEYSIGLSVRHKRLIHLVGLEDWRTLRSFVLKAHARAHVGINSISTSDRFDRIVQQRNATAGCFTDLNGLVNN